MAGALIGAGIPLLFSPNRAQSGAAREKRLSGMPDDQPGEFAQQGQDAVKDAGRSAKEFTQQGQDMVREPGRSALSMVAERKERTI